MAIASTFKIEIESSASWIDVTGSVTSLSDGTTSAAQLVPTINISFGIDGEDVEQYLNPSVDSDIARLRVTENTTTTYYLFEDTNGTVAQDYPFPIAAGRAFCGRVTDFPLLTYVNAIDLPMSAVARQICVENVENQTGDVISVDWQATEDPTVPGKRLEFNRADRLTVLRNLAESCGAGVRATADGMGFEIYDIPSKALTDSATFDYAHALSLSYNVERIDLPRNAIRIKGAAFDYSLGKIPVINVFVRPDTIPANGTSTATAAAQVFDASGVPVQHSSLIDVSIDADSFTIIPVSGCYEVIGVWLNTGTQSVPIRGARVIPTTFTASTITVPDNSTDLFMVSYVTAETVTWAIEDYADKVIDEAQTTTGTLAVSTTNNIGQVIGVYRASDTRKVGTNFFTGGSFTPNTKPITLGISPGATGQAVIIDYIKYNANPLTGVNVSPASSLCNENGIAETVVGSGTAVGSGLVVAFSLGQQGEAQLSLTGSGVGSLFLEANPARIRRSIEAETIVNNHVGEVSIIIAAGSDRYTELDNPIFYATAVTVAGFPSSTILKWENIGSSYRLYVTGLPTAGAATATAYQGYEVVSEEDKTSTITATVLKEDNTAVTNGTTVYFEFRGSSLGCSLSSPTATTTDGSASINLTSGTNYGTVTVRAIVGGYKSEVKIEVTDDDATGGNYARFGSSGGWSWDVGVARLDRTGNETCSTVPNDDNDDDGSVSGTRRLVDCDGKPIPDVPYTINGVTATSDEDGYITFSNGSTGSNEVSVGGSNYSFEIAPKNSSARGGSRSTCTDDATGATTYEGPV